MKIRLCAALLLAAPWICHASIEAPRPPQEDSRQSLLEVPVDAARDVAPGDTAAAAFRRGDYAIAVRLLQADALKGDANAQHNLGYMYVQGLGVERDVAQALEWYRKSAEQGFAESLNDLGFMYANGSGVPQDLVQAYVLFTQAASTGDEKTLRLALDNRKSIAQRMTEAQLSEAERRLKVDAKL